MLPFRVTALFLMEQNYTFSLLPNKERVQEFD